MCTTILKHVNAKIEINSIHNCNHVYKVYCYQKDRTLYFIKPLALCCRFFDVTYMNNHFIHYPPDNRNFVAFHFRRSSFSPKKIFSCTLTPSLGNFFGENEFCNFNNILLLVQDKPSFEDSIETTLCLIFECLVYF